MVVVASSNADQNWRLAAKGIVAVAVSLLHAFSREGIPPFSQNEAHSQMGSVRPHSHGKPGGWPSLANKIISLPKVILSTFSRLTRGPDLTRVGTILQQIFLGAFLGATVESLARPACYSSALKLDGAKNNGTRPRRHKNSRSGLGRSQGRNRAPCHRRHLLRYCGGTRRRNPASHAYVKSMIATYHWSLPDERIQ